MSKDSFIFYRSFYEATKILPDKKRLKIYEMIIELGLNDKKIEENDNLIKSLFTLIEPQISANNERYENGKKGGRPKKNKELINTPKKTNGFEKIKTNGYENKKPNENVNENDNVNVNENVNENDNVLISSSYERIEAELGRVISSTEYEQFKIWLDELGEEMLLYAINRAVFAGVKTIRYINGIITNWKNSGYKTKQDVLDNEKRIEEIKNKEPEELFDYDWLSETEE